jgi:hypothetical protein
MSVDAHQGLSWTMRVIWRTVTRNGSKSVSVKVCQFTRKMESIIAMSFVEAATFWLVSA